MNLAVALTSGKVNGASPELDPLTGQGNSGTALLDAIDHALFAGSMSGTTRKAIARELQDVRDSEEARSLAIGLALGSPEFQKQ
jgi:hypothetical protein